MKPLVSILIPAFNAEQWIEETLRSAVAQTWPHTEIIIVDDGSTDRTLRIAKRFESKSVRSFVSGDHRLATLAAFACVSLVPGWPHRACCSAWRVTEHAFLLALPGSSCPIPTLRPSSNPLIRRRSHSCVSDVSHSSESEAPGQGHNAKSTGYPQEFR